MKTILLFILIYSIAYRGVAQEESQSPTLQVGLSGINVKKGFFDSELVAQIISEKQNEIKVALIKNMLLKKIGVDNGLFYCYIDNAIDIIAKEKDNDTRMKNLLENTVNLSFVCSYADYYLKTLDTASQGSKDFLRLAQDYGLPSSILKQRSLALRDLSKIEVLDDNDNYNDRLANEFVSLYLDLIAEVVRNNEGLKKIGLMRTNYFQNFSNMSAYLNLIDENSSKNRRFYTNPALQNYNADLNTYNNEDGAIRKIFSSLKRDSFLVNTYDSSLNNLNIYLQQLKSSANSLKKCLTIEDTDLYHSFPDIKYYNTDYYCSMLNYSLTPGKSGRYNKKIAAFIKLYSTYDSLETELMVLIRILNKGNLAQKIYNEVTENLKSYLKYVGLLKAILNTGANNSSSPIKDVVRTIFNCDEIYPYSAIKDLRLKLNDSGSKLDKKYKSDLDNINSFIDKLQYVGLNKFELLSKWETSVKISVNNLAPMAPEVFNLKDKISCFLGSVTSQEENELANLNIKLNSPFLSLIAHVDEFDKSETYVTFLNQLSDVGDVFSDDGMRSTINQIIGYIRSYIKPVESNNKVYLQLDVEGFLTSLQRIQLNKNRPVQLLFTLGANNAVFNKAVQLNDLTTVKNFTFFGEKIGLKFKIFDRAYYKGFARGETFSYYGKKFKRNFPAEEPIISNYHFIIYGSGLLYNLINTKTNKSFNFPLIGMGPGITFFNNLDLNFSIGRPIISSKEIFSPETPIYYNVGFDILFAEYIDRLNQKRKENKSEKKIANIYKNASLNGMIKNQ